jgi:hypothetical protein
VIVLLFLSGVCGVNNGINILYLGKEGINGLSSFGLSSRGRGGGTGWAVVMSPHHPAVLKLYERERL